MYQERVKQDLSKKQRLSYTVYEFDSMNSVIQAAKRLLSIGEGSSCFLYYDEEKSAYYFLMENINAKELRLAFLNEYSVILRTSLIPYIKEHSKCLRKKDAIRVIGNI